jgi:phage gp36-like protein
MPYTPAYLSEAEMQTLLESKAAQLTNEGATYNSGKALELIEQAEGWMHGFIGHRYPFPITHASWVSVLKAHAVVMFLWAALRARLIDGSDELGKDIEETLAWLKMVRQGRPDGIDLVGVDPYDLSTEASTTSGSSWSSHTPVYGESTVRGV